jgi:hypothetical protein
VRSGQRFYKLLKADLIGGFLKQHPEVAIPKELEADANKLSDKNGLLVVAFKLKD